MVTLKFKNMEYRIKDSRYHSYKRGTPSTLEIITSNGTRYFFKFYYTMIETTIKDILNNLVLNQDEQPTEELTVDLTHLTAEENGGSIVVQHITMPSLDNIVRTEFITGGKHE